MPNTVGNLALNQNEMINPVMQGNNVILLTDHQKKLKLIDSKINALLNIRLSLSVKKLVSKTISKEELKQIVDKERNKDLEVDKELDSVFNDYFKDTAAKTDAGKIWNENQNISLAGVEAKIDSQVLNDSLSLDEMKKIQDSEKGASLTLRDGNHFKTETTQQ